MVSTEQAVGCGLSRHALARLVKQNQWQRLGYGVYFTAPGEVPWAASAWGGVLVGGEHARLGPQASAFLHNLRSQKPHPIDVLTSRQVREKGPWIFRRERPGARSPRTRGAPPRLTVEDTVIDLSGLAGGSETVRLVMKAVQDRVTTPDRLARCLDGRVRHPHRQLLENLLQESADGVNSALELSYKHDVERAHGLPRARRQMSRLGLPYHSDVGYEDYQLLVELDGRDGHLGEGRFRDMWRDNRNALQAWLTLRYGWFDVTDHPCLVAGQVAAVLIKRGWPGHFQRCARCRQVPDHELLELV